jgi:hypothetical protein
MLTGIRYTFINVSLTVQTSKTCKDDNIREFLTADKQLARPKSDA